jgi:hypothetical protein
MISLDSVRIKYLLPVVIGLWIVPSMCLGASVKDQNAPHDRFLALQIVKGDAASPRMHYRYGVPFMETAWHAPANGSLEVNVGIVTKKIFLLGMTESMRPSAWSDPRNYSVRFMVGDKLGQIVLHYADGSTQEFPLILGESAWWGLPFYQTREPFPADVHLRSVFAQAMRLYPAAPTDDGNYVAVIEPKDAALASIEVVGSAEKKGSVAIAGITVESAPGTSIAGATAIPINDLSPEFSRFVQVKSLRQSGVDESGSELRLNNLKKAFYTTDAVFKQPIPAEVPLGFTGPLVTFKGTNQAAALENAFYANLQDMSDKVDAEGMYHTSTHGALAWAGDPRSAGGEFGTFRKDVGVYYNASWSRDLGRSLQELTELGYFGQASKTAEYSLRDSRLWTENPALTYKGQHLPPHWSRVINAPDPSLPFENDGHGLISLFIYKIWQRTPDRDAWLRSHWTDVKAAGDWILWQFDHPEISGVADGVLYTTGESAAGKGYSVYPDAICMTALEALAQMADSIGETTSAAAWRDRAEKMRKAIPARYLIHDSKYGPVWTLEFAGWPNQSTVLGPLITLADYRGFMPEDDDPVWRPANEAAYQRLIDSYHPFGFYGCAMGYGQGFVTQAALLLDRMKDATTMLDWTAREAYDPQIHSFIVPEGAQIDPTGQFMYRSGDHGNGVQEAEIVKALRIMIGVDDTEPGRLRLLPRMPYGWSEIAVDRYPVLTEHSGKTETALVQYKLERIACRINLDVSSSRELGTVTMRLGPFDRKPSGTDVLINGRSPDNAAVVQSGDSWWVGFKATVGPARVTNRK